MHCNGRGKKNSRTIQMNLKDFEPNPPHPATHFLGKMIGWLFCSLIKSRLWQDSGSQHEKCVFDADDLMHCISGLDKASLRPSAIFTFDIKSRQYLFVNFGSNMVLLAARSVVSSDKSFENLSE